MHKKVVGIQRFCNFTSKFDPNEPYVPSLDQTINPFHQVTVKVKVDKFELQFDESQLIGNEYYTIHYPKSNERARDYLQFFKEYYIKLLKERYEQGYYNLEKNNVTQRDLELSIYYTQLAAKDIFSNWLTENIHDRSCYTYDRYIIKDQPCLFYILGDE